MFSVQEKERFSAINESGMPVYGTQLKCRHVCHESAIGSEADLNRTSSEVSV
jgi:hypothetical protein